MTNTIRDFYRRLNHQPYGVTELAIIDPGNGIIVTGFFDSEDAFCHACTEYNGRYNIYAGRNPRPKWLPKVCSNYLDIRYKQRASDSDIEYLTAISLDIDPIRPKGTSSTDSQRRRAIEFAIRMHNEIGGWVDDSGNGAYLWIPFENPVHVTNENRNEVKQKCRLWQENIIKAYKPGQENLRIDGCYDLSRLKKVIGTISVKGVTHRKSGFVRKDGEDDRVRDAILNIEIPDNQRTDYSAKPPNEIPQQFIKILRSHPVIQHLWTTPNPQNDSSMHDWMLGCELVKCNVPPEQIAAILMRNPFGKYQRDRRYEYIRITVSKLMGGSSGTG